MKNSVQSVVGLPMSRLRLLSHSGVEIEDDFQVNGLEAEDDDNDVENASVACVLLLCGPRWRRSKTWKTP